MLINFYTKNVQSHLVFKRKWKIIFDFSETWAQLLNPSKDNLFWFWPERRHGEKQKLYHIKRKNAWITQWNWIGTQTTPHTRTHTLYMRLCLCGICVLNWNIYIEIRQIYEYLCLCYVWTIRYTANIWIWAHIPTSWYQIRPNGVFIGFGAHSFRCDTMRCDKRPLVAFISMYAYW